MDKYEKILLLQLILEDIRGNWGWENSPRVPMARELAADLDLKAHVELIDLYDYEDGRHFRTDMEHGGYYGMSNLHGLERTIRNKSDEFKKLAEEYLTYPDSAFEDWDQYKEEQTNA